MKRMRQIWLAGLVLLSLSAEVSAQSNVAMQDSIPEIVVTGTGTEHYLKDAPVQTEVISRKMLDSYAGATLEDILSGLCASLILVLVIWEPICNWEDSAMVIY